MPGSRLPNICRKDDLTSGRNDDVTSGDEEFSAAANRARIRAMEAVWRQHKFKFSQITWVPLPLLFYAFKIPDPCWIPPTPINKIKKKGISINKYKFLSKFWLLDNFNYP
jgi:hypothetical protein